MGISFGQDLLDPKTPSSGHLIYRLSASVIKRSGHQPGVREDILRGMQNWEKKYYLVITLNNHGKALGPERKDIRLICQKHINN
jgi:hypothetical protein